MKRLPIALLLIGWAIAARPQTIPPPDRADTTAREEAQLLERLRNMPNVEVGKGITFRPGNERFELTLRFRMQDLVSIAFDEEFSHRKTEARVKRLRLRLDGYIHSPRLVYSIQLGFASHDSDIVRDAVIYYVPDPHWNIGFGQTKIKANRARINSSGALQFADRSIVSSHFNLGRDFGFFGEYDLCRPQGFDLAAKGSVTLGEGLGQGGSSDGGMAYMARLELYPCGRFSGKGDVQEGDLQHEERVRILLAGAYAFNHKAVRLKGTDGDAMPGHQSRNLGSYFVDFILKYKGFAFCADLMGRRCRRPLFDEDAQAFVYSGCGLNVQASYLFGGKWEVALRNSALFPEREIRPQAGYDRANQVTLGATRYIVDHNVKIQADMSYNSRTHPTTTRYNRWEIRFQLELGI